MKITRKRVFITLIIGALALGIAGGAALLATVATTHTAQAHGGYGKWGGNGNSGDASFAARVADKLNAALGLEQDITESQVQTAFDAAAADRQAEALSDRLDDLEVDSETKTAIMDWFTAYPYDDLIRLRPLGLAPSDKVSSYLERLVERERITQAQADGIQSWYDQRPALPEGVEPAGKSRRHRGGDNDNGADARFRHRDGRGGGPGSFFRGRHGRGGNGFFNNPL